MKGGLYEFGGSTYFGDGTPLEAYRNDTLTPSLAKAEQVKDAAFQAQPLDPCEEGHVWEHYASGEVECSVCGMLTFNLDEA